MMRDLDYAWRMIRKRPGLALVAVLSLALGIGVNTTIFSFANALLFRQPPVAHPERMVEVYIHNPDPDAGLEGLYPLSYPGYLDFAARTRSLSGLAIYNPGSNASVVTNGGGTGQPWTGQLVSPNYFEVLGLRPARGRWFLPAEGTTPGAAAVVVLSYAAWKSKLGGESDAVGKTITMNGMPYTVIGIAPRGFQGLFTGVECDWWAPTTMAARLGLPNILDSRHDHGQFAVGRLRPGVTVAQADADINLVERTIARQHPDALPARWGATVRPLGLLPTPFRGFVGIGAGLLMAVVGLVLLIACANAALVLLVEALGRRREWALRAALGATRGRLIRQGLVHSILLAVIAGGLGLLLGQWLGPLLLELRPPGYPVALNLGLDSHLLLFTVAVALATGALVGLAPAWQGARARVLDNLKDGTPGGGSARSRARSGFIVAQVALCVIVLVGAGLCLRSLQHASAINPGFDSGHVLFAQVNPASQGYAGAAAEAYLARVRTAVTRLGGVRAAAWTTHTPLQLSDSGTSVLPPGMAPPPHRKGFAVDDTVVGPGYFAAAGTRLLAGRDFTEADLAPGHARPIVINQMLARHFWPHGGALGQSLILPGSKPDIARIVGIAEDGKYRSLGEAPRPFVFELQTIAEPATLVIAVNGPPAAFESAISHTLAGLDPDLTAGDVQTGAQFMLVPLFPARFTGILLGGFGLLALALAVVGLYGVIAASVAQRTREYGIRLALGAGGRRLLGQVLGQGLRLAAWGIAAGVALALLLTHFMAALLYGMSPLDPWSYCEAAVLLLAVAALASLVPALRATRVDPLRALRWE